MGDACPEVTGSVEQLGVAALLAIAPGERCQASLARSGKTLVASANTICSICGGNLAPARRFLKRRGGAGAVADVGNGDLHGVLVHLDVLMAEDFRADDRVLGEVLGNAAANHQEAGSACFNLEVGQLKEVGDGVEHHIRLAGLHRGRPGA